MAKIKLCLTILFGFKYHTYANHPVSMLQWVEEILVIAKMWSSDHLLDYPVIEVKRIVLIVLHKTGVGKLQPQGHMRPATGLSAAHESLQQIQKKSTNFC